MREFKSLSSFEENLKMFVRLVRTHGSELILLTEPSIYHSRLTQAEADTLYFGPVHMREKGRYPDVASLEYGMRLF